MSSTAAAPRWLPIESNPDVMNKFLHDIGLDKSWSVNDVLGLDDDLLAMVPKPVASVLLLFPVTEKCAAFLKEKNEKVKAEGNKVSKNIYFMKQTIRNACGTMALIHAVANNQELVQLGPGFLKDFLAATKNATPEERAKILEADQGISDVHGMAAQEGQTAAPNIDDKVDYHFVAFVQKDGHLYELDGSKDGALNCGPASADDFLKVAAAECKKYMDQDPDNINFTVLALTGSEE